MSTWNTQRLPTGIFLVIFAALYSIVQIPVYLTVVPPLLDYPNHLARMHILLNIPHSEVLQSFYEIQWAVIPNLAMDLIVPWLGIFMSLEIAGKLFISLTLLLICSGTAALHYALYRRLSLWPLLIFFFLFNQLFLYGFLNYLFGLGLALWVFAAWIFLRRQSVFVQLPLFSAFTCLLFFCHFYALGVYGLAVISYEFARTRNRRELEHSLSLLSEWTPTLAQFAMPIILLVFFSPVASDISDIRFSRIFAKLLRPYYLVTPYHLLTSQIVLLFLTGLLGLSVIKRRLILAPFMAWPLGAFAVVYLIMPFTLFGSHDAYVRVVLAFICLFFASIDIRFKNFNWIAGIGCLLLILFVLQITFITRQWQTANRTYAEFREAFTKMPVGSRLFANTDRVTNILPNPIWHIAGLAVVQRDVFIPTLFAQPRTNAQPIAYNASYAQLATRTWDYWKGETTTSKNWHKLLNLYDYILLDKEEIYPNLPKARLVPVYLNSDFYLYQVDPKTTLTGIHGFARLQSDGELPNSCMPFQRTLEPDKEVRNRISSGATKKIIWLQDSVP